jgi:Co/Zn/Cd efflux system component
LNKKSLYLLNKTKSQEAHIRASTFFTSNDVIINIGVIAAAVLVRVTGSNRPDLIIGPAVFLVLGILQLSK